MRRRNVMGKLARFSVSMDEDLLRLLDRHLHGRGYSSRSEAIRDFAREILSAERLEEPHVEAVAVISIVYDHHRLDLPSRLTELQHKHYHHTVCTLHVHLDEHHCLEVLILRGRAGELSELGNLIIGLNGIKHGKIMLSVPGEQLP